MKRTFAYRLIKEKHPLTAMATEKRNGLVAFVIWFIFFRHYKREAEVINQRIQEMKK